jgi:cobalt/nickel transport system permease protein
MAATAFAAGYLAAVCGAAFTGTMLGLQPLLHTAENGAPLYFPLGLEVSLPAMLGAHMLVGIVEGAVTMGAVLALAAMPEFRIAEPAAPRNGWRKVAVGVACMVVLVPIGVVLPTVMDAGDPWGEWSAEETAQLAGQPEPPAGLIKYSDRYSAPVPDYQFGESETLAGESAQYIGAALLGVILVVLISLPLHKLQQARLRRIREQG